MDVTFSPALRVYAEMWEIAGRRREADAQFAQALAHIRSGTPDAMAKAFDLFKRSGAHNFTEAQFAAGWCCEHGCGTKRNYPQAIRWYKRAENNVTSDVMSAFDPVGEARKSQAFIAHKFSPFILSNFNMTIWPPSIPLVGSLRFPLLCSSCPLQFPPFSHVSHTAYADSPISRKQARKATSLLIYPSIFRG